VPASTDVPLRWPFRRRAAPEPAPRPPRDLNRLILDVAEYQDDEDHDELFRRLADATLYTPAGSGPPPVDLGGGLRFAALYVNGHDPRLGEGPVTVRFAEALQTIERTPGVEGVLLYSDRAAYVAVPGGEFERLRRDYL